MGEFCDDYWRNCQRRGCRRPCITASTTRSSAWTQIHPEGKPPYHRATDFTMNDRKCQRVQRDALEGFVNRVCEPCRVPDAALRTTAAPRGFLARLVVER